MLNKKKSRSIHVDGDQYQWTVSEDSGYSVFVALATEKQGQKLEVRLPWQSNNRDSSNSGQADSSPVIVTPGLAAKLIQQAKTLGWLPSSQGQPIVFDWRDEKRLVGAKRPDP